MITNGTLQFRNKNGELRELIDLPTGTGVVVAVSTGGGVTLKSSTAGAAQIVRGDGSGVDLPTKLPNPAALNILLNGSNQGSYDGSVVKQINVSPATIGAASAEHSHKTLLFDGAVYFQTETTQKDLIDFNIPSNWYNVYDELVFEVSAASVYEFGQRCNLTIPNRPDADGNIFSGGFGTPHIIQSYSKWTLYRYMLAVTSAKVILGCYHLTFENNTIKSQSLTNNASLYKVYGAKY